MKAFLIDQAIEEENFCNFESEREALRRHIKQKNHIVLYGPRNFGKTSLVKNIIGKEFKQTHPESFVFFADLIEVRSMEMLVSRLRAAFENSFRHSFPAKNLIQKTKRLLSALRPEINIDPLTGQPSLSITLSEQKHQDTIIFIFEMIQDLAKKMPSLIIIDEFQDIAIIPEAQAHFRAAFEITKDTPIILLGSKNHILSQIFANPNAPLASWGQDISMGKIPYTDYHLYIKERFSQNKNTISLETATELQDLVKRVPESINTLCQHIHINHENTVITPTIVNTALQTLLESKTSRFESYLAHFSDSEQKILIEISRIRIIEKPQSIAFIKKTEMTNKSVSRIIKKLWDNGVITKQKEGYELTDPLLEHYIRLYRI